MISYFDLSHRFKRSMLEITSESSYDILWNYLKPLRKERLPDGTKFRVASGKKSYDIIRLFESGEEFYSQKVIDVLSQFVDMSDKCYPIEIENVNEPYYVIYNLEAYPFWNRDESLFEDEPFCFNVQDSSFPLFGIEDTRRIMVSSDIRDALFKNKLSNVKMTECFGCSWKEYQKMRNSEVWPKVHVYEDK